MVDTAPRTTSKTSRAGSASAHRSGSNSGSKIARPAASAPAPSAVGDAAAAPKVDVASLGRQLLGTWADIRVAARERAARPDLQRIDGQSMAEHRERVLGQLKLLVEDGAVHRAFPKELGGHEDHGGNIAAFEELVLA
jgi:acyl-CoA oxidase